MAECECKTKKKLREDARLTDEELDDFFEVCKLALQQARWVASLPPGANGQTARAAWNLFFSLVFGTRSEAESRRAEAAPDFDMDKLETEAERHRMLLLGGFEFTCSSSYIYTYMYVYMYVCIYI